MVARAAEDHRHAQELAAAIQEISGLELTTEKVDSNIVLFRVDARLGTAAQFAARLQEHGVRMLSMTQDLIRAVTHLDLPKDGAQRTGKILRQVAGT